MSAQVLPQTRVIKYRGGNYTLTRYNYRPDKRRDRRRISLADAMGKSCNPAFARVALNRLSLGVLQNYAVSFGFNGSLPFDLPLDESRFNCPNDDFEVARTAAGFGDVTVSPLHAAVITAAIANDGKIMKPYIVDRVLDSSGSLTYRAQPSLYKRAVLSTTAQEVLEMMVATVETGTARRYFKRSRNPKLREIQVAAKTGDALWG